MANYQAAKKVVLEYFDDVENASADSIAGVLRQHTSDGYLWRGVYPFREQDGAKATAASF